MIPLIVHQTEETLDQIPDSVAETMKEFRKILMLNFVFIAQMKEEDS